MNNTAEVLDTIFEIDENGTGVNLVNANHPLTYFEEDEGTANFPPSGKKTPSEVPFGAVAKINTPRIPTPMARKAPRFKTTRKLVGEVIEIYDDSFLARVYSEDSESISHDSFEDYVDFKVAEVNEEDRKLIELGAIFNWHIGQRFRSHDLRLNGQVENSSIVVFRRMPIWKNYLGKAQKEANEFADIMGWSDNS